MGSNSDHVSVAIVFFCHDREGRFLLQRRGGSSRDEQGRWSPGAGGLELGETVAQTLVREIREEYGTEVLSYEFLGYRDFLGNEENGRKHWIRLDFKVLVDAARAKNNEPHKFDDVQWFTWETVPADIEMHTEWPTFLAKYRSRLPE